MLLDFVDLSSGSGAVYQRLYEQIAAAAYSGIMKKGERLPSIREAAAQLGVSRTTVESAYLKLCIEGMAESSPYRGYLYMLRLKTAAEKCGGRNSGAPCEV